MIFSKQQKERFFSKVKKTDTCWFWTGVRNTIRGDYGRFMLEKRVELAYRVSWMIHNGKGIPKGMVVMHDCDTPSCVNPKHLRLGLQRDNVADAISKNRMTDNSGSRNGRSKLTENDIPKIRSLFVTDTNTQIAKKFNISPTTIWEIKVGRKWITA